MYLEVFVHIAHLNVLFAGQPVNCKINYADQNDVRLLLDPRKFKMIPSPLGANIITIKKKTLLERLKSK